jgi:hypothetical protein
MTTVVSGVCPSVGQRYFFSAGQNRHWDITIKCELHSPLLNIDVDKLEALSKRIVLS